MGGVILIGVDESAGRPGSGHVRPASPDRHTSPVRRLSLSTGRLDDLATREQAPVFFRQLEYHRLAEGGARNFVEKHDPAASVASFAATRPCDVDDLVLVHPLGAGDRECLAACFDRQDASFRSRRILGIAKGDEKERAERNPQDVDRPPATGTRKHGGIIRNVTRAEIEQELITIVRQEKNIPEDLLKTDTPLADAGIDSLDSLTILFAIEERFRISIPDDRAREMKTFGDMVTIVEELAG